LLLKTRARQQLETFGQPLDLFFFGLVNIELGLVVHGLLQFGIWVMKVLLDMRFGHEV